MTEQQPYRVVDTYPGFELREYPAHLVAEVTVQAEFEEAGSRAFNPLLQYISGANRANSKMAMTAPVVQGERLAMTAPVVQGSEDSSGYTVAFVLPASVSAESVPTPTDSRVQVRSVPTSITAVTRYSGRWSEQAFNERCAALLKAVTQAGFTTTSQPRFARYDPPFKPWFLRRNEVLVDVLAS